MIEQIAPEHLDAHLRDFENAARRILPVLCYDSQSLEAFLIAQRPGPNQGFFRIRLDNDMSAFLKTRHANSLAIEYLIPSDWHARFQIIAASASLLKAEADRSRREILFRINEEVPSHNAYFGGFLAAHSFNLSPRLEAIAPENALDLLTLPVLQDNFAEHGFDVNDLPGLNDVYNRAHAGYPAHIPEPNAVDRAALREDSRQTFVSLTHHGRIVGFCYGIVPPSAGRELWGDRLNIEELAIHPDYFGRGLGRYLAIRCMQKLKEHYSKPGRGFFVGTDRTFTRAWRLYAGLGYQIRWVHSYARYGG